MALVPIVFTAAEAEEVDRTAKRMSHKTAHAFLAECRLEMGAVNGWDPTEFARDLTEQDKFNWRLYLGTHPERRLVVGDGVVSFWGVVLNTFDSNTRTARFDFVVRRADGSACRLHPGQSGHGVPAYGQLESWVSHTTLQLFPDAGPAAAPAGAAPPGGAPCAAPPGGQQRAAGIVRAPGGFGPIHQVDLGGRGRGREILHRLFEEWRDSPHPRNRFARNLTMEARDGNMAWTWPTLLAALPSCAPLASEVEEFWLAWLESADRPAFWFRLHDGRIFTLDLLSPGGRQLREGEDDIIWE